MSRRHVASKREILPDPKYGDRTVAKFINMVMSRGKKAVAEKIVYGALSEVEHRGKGQAIDVFKQALENVAPAIEVRRCMTSCSAVRAPCCSAPHCTPCAVSVHRALRVRRGCEQEGVMPGGLHVPRRAAAARRTTCSRSDRSRDRHRRRVAQYEGFMRRPLPPDFNL